MKVTSAFVENGMLHLTIENSSGALFNFVGTIGEAKGFGLWEPCLEAMIVLNGMGVLKPECLVS